VKEIEIQELDPGSPGAGVRHLDGSPGRVVGRAEMIQDQITHERSGLLLDDPSDLAAFGRATATLLEDHERAARLGLEAHRRVRQDYLAPRRLTQELDLIQRLTG
jgi:trehalose synthase